MVCVPSATGTMQSATAAAEPLDEPPGVRARSCGLRVLPGCRFANLVATVLPIQDAARLACERDTGGIALRTAAAMNWRAPLGRHVEGVDDILDAEGNTGERSAPAAAVECTRRRDRLIGIETGPGLDLVFARGDAFKARAHDGFAGGAAGANPANVFRLL